MDKSETLIKEIEIIRNAIEVKGTEMRDLTLVRQQKETELSQICTHKEIITKQHFNEGDYYSRSQYITLKVCKVCGTVVDRTVTTGSYA